MTSRVGNSRRPPRMTQMHRVVRLEAARVVPFASPAGNAESQCQIDQEKKMVSGKPKEVSISTTMVLIIIADISRALTMCQALSPKSHTLTRLILAKTLGLVTVIISLCRSQRH